MTEFSLEIDGKRVRFASAEEKDAYVKAEYSSTALEYLNYCFALTQHDRDTAKTQYDQARARFYEHWLSIKKAGKKRVVQ